MDTGSPRPKKPRLQSPVSTMESYGPFTTAMSSCRRPLPHDVVIQICDYLGFDLEHGDPEAGRTLASIMTLSSEAYMAAGRNLYRTVVVRRDTFANVFGGNDTAVKAKSSTSPTAKLFSQMPITFPTRASLVRKLRLFQYTRRLYVSDLPSEQTVVDLNDALRVACSKPAASVACQDTLSGTLFPRVEKVAFSNTVFLNQQSLAPLGPENEQGTHRFLSFLCRESSPRHVCMSFPTPHEVAWYRTAHAAAEKPDLRANEVGAERAGSFSLAAEALWPEYLAASWEPDTIAVHNVRCRTSARFLGRLKCKVLRIFAIDLKDACVCFTEPTCPHDELLWARFGNMITAFAKASQGTKAMFTVREVEIANTGAGFPLTCGCVVEYSNALSWLHRFLRKRAEGASFSLQLPARSLSAPCACCHVGAKPLGGNEHGNPNGDCTPRPDCDSCVHRWEKGLRPVSHPQLNAAAQGNQGNGGNGTGQSNVLGNHDQLHHLGPLHAHGHQNLAQALQEHGHGHNNLPLAGDIAGIIDDGLTTSNVPLVPFSTSLSDPGSPVSLHMPGALASTAVMAPNPDQPSSITTGTVLEQAPAIPPSVVGSSTELTSMSASLLADAASAPTQFINEAPPPAVFFSFPFAPSMSASTSTPSDEPYSTSHNSTFESDGEGA